MRVFCDVRNLGRGSVVAPAWLASLRWFLGDPRSLVPKLFALGFYFCTASVGGPNIIVDDFFCIVMRLVSDPPLFRRCGIMIPLLRTSFHPCIRHFISPDTSEPSQSASTKNLQFLSFSDGAHGRWDEDLLAWHAPFRGTKIEINFLEREQFFISFGDFFLF